VNHDEDCAHLRSTGLPVNCDARVQEQGRDTVTINACGNAVAKAISCAEGCKRLYPNLFEVTTLSHVDSREVYEPLEEGLDKVEIHKRLAAITIVLSTKQLDETDPGYQAPLPAAEARKDADLKAFYFDEFVAHQHDKAQPHISHRGVRSDSAAVHDAGRGRGRGGRGRGRGGNAPRGAATAATGTQRSHRPARTDDRSPPTAAAVSFSGAGAPPSSKPDHGVWGKRGRGGAGHYDAGRGARGGYAYKRDAAASHSAAATTSAGGPMLPTGGAANVFSIAPQLQQYVDQYAQLAQLQMLQQMQISQAVATSGTGYLQAAAPPHGYSAAVSGGTAYRQVPVGMLPGTPAGTYATAYPVYTQQNLNAHQ
jgi:hypothetical protein